MDRNNKRVEKQDQGNGPAMNLRESISEKKEIVFLVVLAAVAAFLLFYNLDKRLLWQDEAQTALVAKTILEKGLPMVADGKNSFSQESGAEAGPDGIYRWHPWLSFYLVAASFTAFGINTFAAKFPFALIGVLTVLMLYFLTKEASGSRRAAAIAAVLLVLSPAFLVLAKQCRYYGPVMLFTLVALREYLLLYSGKTKNIIPLAVSAALLYYSQNMNFGILSVTLIIHAVVFKRELLFGTAAAVFSAFFLCLPWALYSKGMPYRTVYPQMMTFGQFFEFLPQYTTYINRFVARIAILLIPLFLRFAMKKQFQPPAYSGRMALIGGFTVVFVFFLSLFLLWRCTTGILPGLCRLECSPWE
jgi:4-amino-4-deoxy-L-arabinose transferase-like glycosyltransferase